MQKSNALELGRFVCVRERSDGSCRASMLVPIHLRPDGWPKTIRLPELGSQVGRLTDKSFVERVRVDVKRLNDRLDIRRKKLRVSQSSHRGLAELSERYFKSSRYMSLSKSRKYRNERNFHKIVEWAQSRGNPPISEITPACVDDFLSRYALGSASRFDMRATWSLIFTYAKEDLQWVSSHPLKGGDWFTPVPEKVRLWTIKDAELYYDMAHQMRQPGLGAMIMVMMATGQRPGDMRNVKWRENFTGDRLILKQSKTQKKINIPISSALREIILAARVEGSPFLFNEGFTGTGFTATQLFERFSEVRMALTDNGEEILLLRSIRHSCVCRMLMTGLPPAAVAAVTGHSLLRLHGIMERYFIDRDGKADAAMRAMFVSEGNEAEAFGGVQPLEPAHWVFSGKRRREFNLPDISEKNFLRIWPARSGQPRLGYSYPPPEPPTLSS